MEPKQRTLLSYYKREKSNEDESSDALSDESEYVPDNRNKKYKHPMYWSRVLDVHEVNNRGIRAFDVEDDLNNDKAMKRITKHASRETTDFLFDPNDYDEQDVQLN